MTTRFLTPYATFLDANGAPLTGGKLYFYQTGSSTVAADTFSDVTLTTENTNPVVLNSRGEPDVDIFLDPSVTYRVVLKTSADVTIWTADNVTDATVGADAAIAVYPGDPNGNVAGTAGTFGGVNSSMVYDSINDALYVCTTTGDAGSAVWTANTAGSAGLGSANVFTVGQSIQLTEAGASVGPFLTLDWESSTPAASDAADLISIIGEDSAGNDQEYAKIGFIITDPTSTSEDARMRFGVVTAGTVAYELELSGAALYPTDNAGLDLGLAANRFAAAHVNTIELGHATDLTLSRGAAGRLDIEGGAGSLFLGTIELGHATDLTLSRGAAGRLDIEGGAGSLFSGTVELGHASDTTLARSGPGDVTIEGNAIYRAGGTDVPVTDGGTGASTAAAGFKTLGDGLSTATVVDDLDHVAFRRASDGVWYRATVDDFIEDALATAIPNTTDAVSFVSAPTELAIGGHILGRNGSGVMKWYEVNVG